MYAHLACFHHWPVAIPFVQSCLPKIRVQTDLKGGHSSLEMDTTEDRTVEAISDLERRFLIEGTLVFLSHMDKKGMMKEADMRKLFAKASKGAAQRLLDKMKSEIKRLYGQEVVTYESPKGNWLMLKDTSKYKPAAGDDPVMSKKHPKDHLLSAILMFLYMAKDISIAKEIPEEQLYAMLEGCRGHPSFGMKPAGSIVEAAHLHEFINNGWIESLTSVDRKSTETILYSWGPRAIMTVDRMELLEKFCAMVGDDPRQWKRHFEDAKQGIQQPSDATTQAADMERDV